MGKSKKELDAQCWKLFAGEHWQRPRREEARRLAQPTAAMRESLARSRRVYRYCTGTGEYPDIRRSEISEDFFTVSGSTWNTHTSYLYLPDGKMATIRLTRMALDLEPAGYTPERNIANIANVAGVSRKSRGPPPRVAP